MLSFYTALTLCPSDIRKIVRLFNTHGVEPTPLRNVLFTPLFGSPDSLNLIRQLRAQSLSRVMFDSGGYYVQVGRLTYHEIYYPLLQLYREHRWADVYTLPDHVPTSQDSEDEVWRKVKDTVEYGSLFFGELPPTIQERALAVVQGHTYEQVDYCLKAYLDLGVPYLGFGSFGTIGRNSQVNVATNSAVGLAEYAARIAKTKDVKLHFFGLGAPALVAMIYGAGASSFDSSSWIKSAGFGQIYLPFTRGYNISHRNGHSQLQKGIRLDEFEQLKLLTHHDCPFCRSVDELQKHKLYRALHNLIAIRESVDMVNNGSYSTIRSIYENGSPRYEKEFEKWLMPN